MSSLPADSHVHSEWSWDAPLGAMERSCARAVEIGLPGIAFTEHLDHTVWPVATEGPYVSDHLTAVAGPDGLLRPPALDVDGYLAAIDKCRVRFPGLRILSGLELGEPHWHAEACAAVLGAGRLLGADGLGTGGLGAGGPEAGRFDRVLGSLHCLPDADGFAEPWGIYPHRDAHEVVREYLAGVVALVAVSGVFSVLAHIDYPVRSWPVERARPFDPMVFEEEFRVALRATAESGRALEVNTRIPLHATILRWWHEVGGDAVTFGSDAHLPEYVGRGFSEAAVMAEAHGFRPGPLPYDLWGRVG